MRIFCFLIGLFFISIFFYACRKDEFVDYKIIEPLQYFPVYPGSFWIYNTGDTMKIYDAYQSSGIIEYSQKGEETILVLPKLIANQTFNNTDVFINEYSYIGTSNWRFLSLIEGEQYAISNYYQGHQQFRKTIKVDTSIIIGNRVYQDVIIIAEYESACGYGEGCYELKDYFAKDVGLIKREYKNWQDSLFYSVSELEGYFINN